MKELIEKYKELVEVYKHMPVWEYGETLDRITKLESEISALEQQEGEEMYPAWIDVNDHLPDHSCSVIVATNLGNVGEMWYSDEYKWHALKDNAKVTHWMPLPKHPIK
jgi:hypothetical protein